LHNWFSLPRIANLIKHETNPSITCGPRLEGGCCVWSGAIKFKNLESGSHEAINGPVTNLLSFPSARLSEPGFSMQVYVTAGVNSDDSLAPVGSPVGFNTGSFAGYMVNQPMLTISGIAIGSPAKIQFRAWENAAGSAVMVNLGDPFNPTSLPSCCRHHRVRLRDS
jgi:hypothetical protein